MTSHFRTITHGTLEWRGILISVTLEKQRFVDHLQIETLEPPCAAADHGNRLSLAYFPKRNGRSN
jgi:hypothetical protein